MTTSWPIFRVKLGVTSCCTSTSSFVSLSLTRTRIILTASTLPSTMEPVAEASFEVPMPMMPGVMASAAVPAMLAKVPSSVEVRTLISLMRTTLPSLMVVTLPVAISRLLFWVQEKRTGRIRKAGMNGSGFMMNVVNYAGGVKRFSACGKNCVGSQIQEQMEGGECQYPVHAAVRGRFAD